MKKRYSLVNFGVNVGFIGEKKSKDFSIASISRRWIG